MAKVTIATVCYNSVDTIEKTVKSVLEQTYTDMEYLIIDGASEDGTLDIINDFLADERIKLTSEPDDGLYYAMNKAIDRATGKYIIFMNSGDVFANKHVLSDISSYLDKNSEIVYGNVIRIKEKGRLLEKYGNRYIPLLLLLQGKMICHQSIFTRCDIMRQYRFNTDYSITADYDFLMRAVRDKRELKYADVTISIVDNVNGISSSIRNMDVMRQQDDKSLKSNFIVAYYALMVPKYIIRVIKHMKERNLSDTTRE